MRGGKGFKKGKKGGGDDEERRRFVGRAADQDYARVVRALGNRRMLCFCNDGEERVCKIRGALCRGPKKQIIGVGDIVLITLRDFEAADSEDEGGGTTADPTGGARTLVSGRKEIGDIIYKYEAKETRHIRKESGIHRMLLAAEAVVDDDIFDRGGGSSDEEDEEEGEGEGEGEDGGTAGGSGWSRGAARAAAATDDADVDIDAI
jgi:translation initiation factor 1A